VTHAERAISMGCGIDYTRRRLTGKEKRDCIIIGYVCLFAAAYVFYHSVFIALLSGAALPFIVKRYERYKAEKEREILLAQFKDLLYSLSASFAAGRYMRDGLAEAREHLRLLYDDDAPMARELSYMLNQINESRAGEEAVLRDFAARSGIADIRNFIDVYFICRATGADTQKVIAKATELLTDKITIEREIKTLTAQKRFEGKIISLMPIIIILFLNIVSPAYVAGLYTTLTGRIVMTAALVGIVYAYQMIAKLTRIEV